MTHILNITNGDCAVEIMKKADISGSFLPWRDVLHDGPVPKGLALDALSKIRSDFIVSQGWGTPEKIERDFIERDHTLTSFAQYEKVILWFEHDLYDQLQLLQILDWLHEKGGKELNLSIICTNNYLGALSPDEMKALLKYEAPVTENHLLLASKAWAAFRESSPEPWCQLLNEDTSALPFLEGAVIRMLEEYPSCHNGLSRTAQQALDIISKGEKRAREVFGLNQALEERIFLGDSSFRIILQAFIDSNPALLTLPKGEHLTLPFVNDQEITITPAGLEVLSGKRNWFEMTTLERWIGGVHLEASNAWCWNSDSDSIVKKSL